MKDGCDHQWPWSLDIDTFITAWYYENSWRYNPTLLQRPNSYASL